MDLLAEERARIAEKIKNVRSEESRKNVKKKTREQTMDEWKLR